MAVKRLCILLVSSALVARATCPALCTATSNNAAWPCRYHSNGCQVTVAANPARAGAADVNVAVISPYSGGLGELMTMVEPAIAAAAQDVENSNFLPGFRMNLFLGDSKCSVPGATQSTIEALARSPTKHALLADSCSAACEAMNDATQFFNVLQVSPGCISESLSDSARYPYFTRMAPSYRFNVQTLYEFTKLMGFQRVGIVVGYRSINTLGVDYLTGLMRVDVAEGRYNWTVLFTVQITAAGNIADAQSAAEEIERKDSRINIVALYQTEGAMFLCQTYGRKLLSPSYSFMVVSGWWNPGFILERSGASDCPCTVTELHRAAYGVIAADRGPMLNTQDVHGLSGRSFADIYGNYTEECLSFGNGTGVCNHQWAGYFYDGVWLIASILHAYLADGNRSVADLATPAARQALEALSLQVDFAGTTGRVRQFSSPDLEGDRDGVILLRQAGGPPENTFNHLAYRTETGILFQTDVVWSPDSAHRISCSSGTCDLVNGFRPADRSSSCPDGRVWINEQGCSECPQGEFASSQMVQCEPCSIGSFANATGSASCQLCSAGRYSSVARASSCADCPTGQLSASPGGSICTKCPRGSYAELPGQPTCTPCPPGLSTNFEGAVELSMCQCDGFYWEEQCVKCQFGQRFEAGVCVSCNRSVICEEGVIVGNAPSAEEWSKTINAAGLQRTLSQRMTIECLLVVLGINPEENRQKMLTTIYNYGVTVQDLTAGNSSRQIIAAPTTDVLSYLQERVMPTFTSLSSLLVANTASPGGVVLYAIQQQTAALLEVSMAVVDFFVEAAAAGGAETAGLLVNIAGRQRTILQMLLKHVLFIALSVGITESLQELARDKKLFEDSHNAIILGAEWASIPRLTRLCTLHQMRDVTFYYEEAIRGPVQDMLSADLTNAVALAQSAAPNMSDSTDPLAVAMNAAVQLFINDPGTCRPKEQMTDSDWWLLVKGMSSKQSTSQEVYRLYMQVAAGSFVEQGKVELAVLTPTSTRDLNYLTQGSRASGIPAPPTQETFTRLLSLTDTWASLTAILGESLAMEQLPTRDVGRVEKLSTDFCKALQSLLMDTLQDARASLTQRPIGLLAVVGEQIANIHRLAGEAYEIVFGYHVDEVLEMMNETTNIFRSTHKDLVLGAANTSTHPALRRVSSVCLIRGMRSVEDAYMRLAVASLAVAGGSRSEVDSLRPLTAEALALMSAAADSLIEYYEGTNSTCPQANLTSEDFEALMLEASNICVSAKKAFGLLIRREQGDRLGGLDSDSFQTGLSNVTESLEKILLGGFAPRLPAPSGEVAYKLALDVEMAVNSFREAAAIPNLRSAQSAGVAVCEAAETLAKRYVAEGEAIAEGSWLGARAERANWQRALAAEAFGAAAAETPGALSEATLQFEAVHGLLYNEIIPERQDLLQVWQEIDVAWASFTIQLEGQSVAAMSSALSELDVTLASAVPMFGLKDFPNPPTAPWMFAAMYGALGVTLAFCGCAGCYMFHRSRRQKVGDPNAGGPNYA